MRGRGGATPGATGVASNLQTLAAQLDEAVAALEAAEQQAVRSREEYTLAYAKAFLEAVGAMDIRRYTATQNTHSQRLQAETDDQVVRGLRRRVDVVRTRIDVARSIGAAMRAELATLGGQP